MLLLSYLMVSKVKYPNFKKVGIPKATIWVAPILIILVAVMGYLFPTQFPKVVCVPLVLYALFGIKKSLQHLRKKGKKAKRKEDDSSL